MKIDRNIISSLHFVFSLCARVGWCDVCTDFTNVIKVDVDLIIKVDVDVNRGAFCCACSVNFSLMLETAGMRLRQFSAQESRKERSRKIRRKTTMDRVFETTFLIIFPSELRWKRQSLKIVVWCVEGSYFQKAKDCTDDFESCLVIVWAINVDDVICEECKRPVEEH